MLIGKDWKIESDPLDITLSQRIIRKSKNGTYHKVWRVEGYYSSVASALKGMVDQEVLGTGFSDFETVVKKIDELHKLIDGIATQPMMRESTSHITASKPHH